MSDFRDSFFIKAMCNVIYNLKVSVLIDVKTNFFRLKIVLIVTQLENESLEINVSTHQIYHAE